MALQQITTAPTMAAGAFALMACGSALLYFMGRRRFNRMNAAGVETFGGYGSMLLTRLLEACGRLLARAVVLVGFAFMVLAVFNSGLGSNGRAARSAPAKPVATAQAEDDRVCVVRDHAGKRMTLRADANGQTKIPAGVTLTAACFTN